MRFYRMKKIKIEIQHFEGCPNSPVLIERVKRAINGITGIEYTEVIVDSNDKAVEIGFRCSPTLLINGKDIEDQPEPGKPALACRYYPKGLPGINMIKQKIYDVLKK